MIEYLADGSVRLTDDIDPTRTQLFDNTTSGEIVDDAILVFFADAPLPPLPDVPMYKIVAFLLSSPGTNGVGTLMDQVNTYISNLPQPQQALVLNLLNRAPNLVATNPLPKAIQAALEITDNEYRAYINAANALEI